MRKLGEIDLSGAAKVGASLPFFCAPLASRPNSFAWDSEQINTEWQKNVDFLFGINNLRESFSTEPSTEPVSEKFLAAICLKSRQFLLCVVSVGGAASAAVGGCGG